MINRFGLIKLSSVGNCSMYELNKNKESKFSKPLFFNEDETIYSPEDIRGCCFKYLDYIVENKLICAASPRPNFHIGMAKRYGISYIQHGEVAFLFNENDHESDKIIADYEAENKETVDDSSSYATPTGTISLLDVRNELGMGGQIDMNNANVRKLGGRPSGQIAMSDLRGKSNKLNYKLTVGSVTGDLSQDMNTVGFSKDSVFTCGNLVGQQVENSSLYITHVTYSVMKNSIAPFFINLYSSTLIPNELVGKGSKHTNHVDVTMSGKTFRFSWGSHNGQMGYLNTANLSELVTIMNSNLNKTIDVTFRWFN